MATPPVSNSTPVHSKTSGFLCRHCRTQLVTLRNFNGRIRGPVEGILCKRLVGVHTDSSTPPRFQHQVPVVSVSCNGCNQHVGERYLVLDPPNQHGYEGRYKLYLDRILLWDEIRLRDAETRKPIDDN